MGALGRRAVLSVFCRVQHSDQHHWAEFGRSRLATACRCKPHTHKLLPQWEFGCPRPVLYDW